MFFPRIPPFSAQNLFEKHPTTMQPTRKKAPAPPVQRHRVRTVDSDQVSPSMLLYTPKVTAVYPRMLPWSLGLYVFFYVAKKTPGIEAWKDFFLKVNESN